MVIFIWAACRQTYNNRNESIAMHKRASSALSHSQRIRFNFVTVILSAYKAHFQTYPATQAQTERWKALKNVFAMRAKSWNVFGLDSNAVYLPIKSLGARYRHTSSTKQDARIQTACVCVCARQPFYHNFQHILMFIKTWPDVYLTEKLCIAIIWPKKVDVSTKNLT